MKGEFIAVKLGRTATFESIDIEILEDDIEFTTFKKLLSGKVIFNKVVIEKEKIINFFKEHLK